MTTLADPTITTHSLRHLEPPDPPEIGIHMEEDVLPKQSLREILMDKQAEINCSYYDNRGKITAIHPEEKDGIILTEEEKQRQYPHGDTQ